MSLSTPELPKQYRLGILASKSLDDPELIPDYLLDKVATISHLYTNGANSLVIQFAMDNGLPFTVFPLTGGSSLPKSTGLILENVDFALIIADQSSKSAHQIKEACVKKGVKHKIIHFDSAGYWKNRVQNAAALITAMTPEEWEKNPMVKKIAEVL